MQKKIYIAGCGRSGTALLWKLMHSFNSVYCHAGEVRVSIFDELVDRAEQVVVAKRKATSRFELPQVATDIDLIYCVRHPFDVMTSRLANPKRNRRKEKEFYISMQRWLSEYNALNLLRLGQPDRKIQYVRYEDVITSPDSVQMQLAEAYDLEIMVRFSEYRHLPDILELNGDWDGNPRLNAGNAIRSAILEADGRLIQNISLRKWERDSELLDYIYSFPREVRYEFLPFCAEFGYDLPGDYLRPD